MRLPRVRFTIRSLLIAIGGIAGLLALPDPWRFIVITLSIPCLALLSARWLQGNGRLGMAGICFWTLAVSINALYAVLSAFPGIHLALLCMAWLVLVLPTLAGFGIAWAKLTAGDD